MAVLPPVACYRAFSRSLEEVHATSWSKGLNGEAVIAIPTPLAVTFGSTADAVAVISTWILSQHNSHRDDQKHTQWIHSAGERLYV